MAGLLAACSDDPCEDVTCGPGVCEDGTCICPAGYEGSSCETETRSLYYGTYVLSNVDCGSPDTELDIETVQIRAGNNMDITSIELVLEGEEVSILQGFLVDDSIIATAEIIDPNFGAVNVEVNGTITSPTTIDGQLTLAFFLGVSTCSFELTRN